MCIHPRNQATSQEPPVPSSSPSSPERDNTEPQPERDNSEPQPQPNPPPEPASESRKRTMPEPNSPDPNLKPHHAPNLHGTSTSSNPPPPLSIPVGVTDAFQEDFEKYLPVPLEELNRQSPSFSSTQPPPPPTFPGFNDDGEDLFKFIPSTLFDEPEPLTTILPDHDDQNLDNVGKDWPLPTFMGDAAERISAIEDPYALDEVYDAQHIDHREPEPNLRRRRMSAPGSSTSASVSYVPVDDDAYQPVPAPFSRLVGAGIKNMKNTCFMAAILQCLTHTGQMFMGLRYYPHETPCGAKRFCVLCAFRDHNDQALERSRSAIIPSAFLINMKEFSDDLEPYSQGDAHEFLIGALNKLKSCFPNDKNNLITQIFGGETLSQLECSSCGFSSDTPESHLDLSLEIEGMSTVERALQSYTQKERMDEKFPCDGCNQEVDKDKRLVIHKAPSILALHLKRFKTDGLIYEKIENHVYFSMELNLQPFTLGNGGGDGILNYHLYAVVVHSGSTLDLGHYYSFVRSSENQWHLMDDSEVSSVSIEYVLGQEAYILFYAKEGTAWFSSVMETEEKDLRPKSKDNTLDCGSKEKDYNDLTEANDNDLTYANDCDSMYTNDNDSMYIGSSDGNEKTASDMEEECDLADANKKDSKDADHNDSKDASEKSVSSMDGEECDLADANDKDSKDANEKSVSSMGAEECDLADANDKDFKDADDNDSKDANEKSVSSMDAEECDLADANDNDSKDADNNDFKVTNKNSASGMDGEECDLADVNDNDSKNADDNDSKVTNEKSVTGVDGEECDLADANDDNDSEIANERFVSDMDEEDVIRECKTLHLGK